MRFLLRAITHNHYFIEVLGLFKQNNIDDRLTGNFDFLGNKSDKTEFEASPGRDGYFVRSVDIGGSAGCCAQQLDGYPGQAQAISTGNLSGDRPVLGED